jgi:hypothetical protein
MWQRLPEHSGFVGAQMRIALIDDGVQHDCDSTASETLHDAQPAADCQPRTALDEIALAGTSRDNDVRMSRRAADSRVMRLVISRISIGSDRADTVGRCGFTRWCWS